MSLYNSESAAYTDAQAAEAVLAPISYTERIAYGYTALAKAADAWRTDYFDVFNGLDDQQKYDQAVLGYRIASLWLKMGQTDKVDRILNVISNDGVKDSPRDRIIQLYCHDNMRQHGVIARSFQYFNQIASPRIRQELISTALVVAAWESDPVTTDWASFTIADLVTMHNNCRGNKRFNGSKRYNKSVEFNPNQGRELIQLPYVDGIPAYTREQAVSALTISDNYIGITATRYLVSLAETLLTEGHTDWNKLISSADVISNLNPLEMVRRRNQLLNDLPGYKVGELIDISIVVRFIKDELKDRSKESKIVAKTIARFNTILGSTSIDGWLSVQEELRRLGEMDFIPAGGPIPFQNSRTDRMAVQHDIWGFVADEYPLEEGLKKFFIYRQKSGEFDTDGLYAYLRNTSWDAPHQVLDILPKLLPLKLNTEDQWTTTIKVILSYIEGLGEIDAYDREMLGDFSGQLAAIRLRMLERIADLVDELPEDENKMSVLASFYRWGSDKCRIVTTYTYFPWKECDWKRVFNGVAEYGVSSVGGYLKYISDQVDYARNHPGYEIIY